MTDYEIGIIVGVLITWPIASVGMALVIELFTGGRR